MKIYLSKTVTYLGAGGYIDLFVWKEGVGSPYTYIKEYSDTGINPNTQSQPAGENLEFGKDLAAIYHSIGFFMGRDNYIKPIRKAFFDVEALCGTCVGDEVWLGMAETDTGYRFCTRFGNIYIYKLFIYI